MPICNTDDLNLSRRAITMRSVQFEYNNLEYTIIDFHAEGELDDIEITAIDVEDYDGVSVTDDKILDAAQDHMHRNYPDLLHEMVMNYAIGRSEYYEGDR
jgi:hypothetical protein